MLETEAITLMTLEKIEDNFTSGIKGKRLNPYGLRNLTRGKNPRNLSLFIYSVLLFLLGKHQKVRLEKEV